MIAHSDIAYVIDPRGHARYIIDANPGPGTQVTRSSFPSFSRPPSAACWNDDRTLGASQVSGAVS